MTTGNISKKYAQFHRFHHSSSSSNLIFLNGNFETGINRANSPEIFIMIDSKYSIVTGNTKEYHATNSPNASNPNPTPTDSAPFCFPSKYDTRVSMQPYTSKINENALIICSIDIVENTNKGRIPIDLK